MMTAWYPLVEKVDNLKEANNRFRCKDFELVEVVLQESLPDFEDLLHQDTIDTIVSTYPKLKSRLTQAVERKPDVAMVICEDHKDWRWIYQALFIGQLIEDGD